MHEQANSSKNKGKKSISHDVQIRERSSKKLKNKEQQQHIQRKYNRNEKESFFCFLVVAAVVIITATKCFGWCLLLRLP